MREEIDHRTSGPVVVSGIEAGEPVGPGEMREITRSLPRWNANRGLSGGIHDDGGRAEDGSSWIGSNRVEEGKSPPPEIRIEPERGPNPSPNEDLGAGEGGHWISRQSDRDGRRIGRSPKRERSAGLHADASNQR